MNYPKSRIISNVLLAVFGLITFINICNYSQAQNIVKVEYFINSDPGFGLGTNIPITPSSNILNQIHCIDLNMLNNGFSYVYIRAKDENGLWSLTNVVSFFKDNIKPTLADIVKAEYFINTDPGLGNGTDIPITSSTHLSDINFIADITTLDKGFHHIYLRVRNSDGVWSLTNIKSFLKETFSPTPFEIVKAEYFFNTDPGIGNGTNIPIASATQITGISFSADISMLEKGFHNLYMRVKNSEGQWSLTNIRSFYIENFIPAGNIVAVEYFLNTDPGFGNGVNIPITPGNPLIAANISANINSLDNGFNHLYLRAKDNNGVWSLTNIVAFYKDAIDNSIANIVAAEYFFNTDPGIGNGTPITVAPGQNISVLASASLSELSTQGVNRLYIRTKDAKGKWSHTNIIYFTIDHLVTLLSNPIGGGQIDGGGWYSNNYELTIKATSNLGFIFLNWSEGGVFLSNLPEYTLFVNSHKTITANFEEFEIKPGDVNNDGLVNVLDMVWLISHILGETPGGFNHFNADVNSDGIINIADLSALINIIIEL
ncbi:MAG: dockerin type I repeat-containing protein [Bacteroidetes bacterium]|nr:dockerin type I repeat-containing protein [Bacteroidota bacterium]